jgi:TonB family protein
MRCFALRLVVALLTFAVGVTLAALWYTNRTEEIEVRVAPAPAPVAVAPLPHADLPPPPPPPRTRMTISGGVLNGKPFAKPQPAYPPIAKAARASGPVTVQIVVDESGRVEWASAVSGHPLLRQPSEDAARQARFAPTLLSGQPVKVSGVITYNFVLQ